jgi:hypothetical protein
MPVFALYDASLNGTIDLPAPEGEWVALHCSGSVTVSLAQATAGFVTLKTVAAPGERILCTGQSIRLVTAGAVNVRLIREKP